ncbi:MAG: nucleoside triphosphate pyrophosphohydrolase [Firmicutes bacterium]|nr:nucleoside triphosphate pyrophosphohydrolase [Bacillota bacterium]
MDFEKLRKDSTDTGEAFERLVEIIRYLRSEDGCPWDKVQTHESLKKCLIEESYEVIDAIDKKDKDSLEEELGDLILQGVFHGLIAEDDKNFDLTSVLNRVSNKMIFRHPHVFLREIAENRAETLDNALIKWENMKHQEKRQKSQTQVMVDIPRQLPALMRSYKIQKKARDVGFDWDNVKEAFAKVKEETVELEEICSAGDHEHILEEVGDLLFSVVNVARFLDIDPEEALTFTSDKFVRRFEYIEKNAALRNKELTSMTLEEMDRLWEEAKDEEKNT